MSDHVELKRLQTRKNDLERSLSSLSKERKDIDSRFARERAALASIDDELRSVATRKQSIILTEHAILRYLERVWCLDIEAIKREILPPEIESHIRALGNGSFPIEPKAPNMPKYFVRVKNGTVVTVEPDKRSEV